MRQFVTIAVNSFMEMVRQPVFLLLMTSTAAFGVALAAMPYMSLGDDPKLVKNSVLALMFLSGLFGAVLSASSTLAHEIRSGTALAVLAKPVGRVQFLLAKYVGLAGALAVMTYVNTLSALLASHNAFDAYGDANVKGTFIFFGFLALGYLVAGFSNYFLRRPFVADAVFSLVVMATIGFLIVVNFTENTQTLGVQGQVDKHLIPAAVLILFALWILAGVALACSTRLETIPTLAVCTCVFLVGLMSDYLFGRFAQESWVSATLYAAVPNWQLFWMADAVETGREINWTYVGKAFVYVIGYLGASLAVALMLFEDRELN